MHTDQITNQLHLEASGVPIYVQLREQLLTVIGSGLLKPSQQLPTMRELAVALRVDLNTVRRAYDELERIGVITIIRAKGTYVAERPPPLDPKSTAAKLDDTAHKTIAAARAAGLDPESLARRILEISAQKGEA